jgi:hypothetical protein
VLIWKDGREACFASAGFTDREAGRRMTRDRHHRPDLFHDQAGNGRGVDAVVGTRRRQVRTR